MHRCSDLALAVSLRSMHRHKSESRIHLMLVEITADTEEPDGTLDIFIIIAQIAEHTFQL